MNYNLIHQLLEQHGETSASLARGIKRSPSGLGSSLKRETLTVETLELIADFFKVDVVEFFSDTPSTKSRSVDSETINTKDDRRLIRVLEDRIKDKELIIIDKNRIIKMLEKTIEK